MRCCARCGNQLDDRMKKCPVYGRTAVCVTDGEGELLGITQDLRDMPRGLLLYALTDSAARFRAALIICKKTAAPKGGGEVF